MQYHVMPVRQLYLPALRIVTLSKLSISKGELTTTKRITASPMDEILPIKNLPENPKSGILKILSRFIEGFKYTKSVHITTELLHESSISNIAGDHDHHFYSEKRWAKAMVKTEFVSLSMLFVTVCTGFARIYTTSHVIKPDSSRMAIDALYRDGEPAYEKHSTLITATACAPGSCRNEGLRSRTRVAYLVENTTRHYYCRVCFPVDNVGTPIQDSRLGYCNKSKLALLTALFILKLGRNTRYLQSIRGMIIKDDSQLIGECLNTETQDMPVTGTLKRIRKSWGWLLSQRRATAARGGLWTSRINNLYLESCLPEAAEVPKGMPGGIVGYEDLVLCHRTIVCMWRTSEVGRENEWPRFRPRGGLAADCWRSSPSVATIASGIGRWYDAKCHCQLSATPPPLLSTKVPTADGYIAVTGRHEPGPSLPMPAKDHYPVNKLACRFSNLFPKHSRNCRSLRRRISRQPGAFLVLLSLLEEANPPGASPLRNSSFAHSVIFPRSHSTWHHGMVNGNVDADHFARTPYLQETDGPLDRQSLPIRVPLPSQLASYSIAADSLTTPSPPIFPFWARLTGPLLAGLLRGRRPTFAQIRGSTSEKPPMPREMELRAIIAILLLLSARGVTGHKLPIAHHLHSPCAS
ncbi:hypothetical protein HYFRA_00007362 [Hymenoscyphus fraxineus]|uniref:Uncharacterized protein n=1 Tax=Hymenoscyphus fraxineus TaxID=746836 RepID=A0A9N9KQC3_9HELO|nr:hypothetical protein HYFRA_00007362 [Hymenoscyphus fraxineus]